MSADLLKWREEFPALEGCVHLISHSLGCIPRRAGEYMAEFATLSVLAERAGSIEMVSASFPMEKSSPLTASSIFSPMIGSVGSFVLRLLVRRSSTLIFFLYP